MSSPSNWPLSNDAIRFVVPDVVLNHLSQNPLSQGVYPLALGYYPVAKGHAMERVQHDDNLLIYCVDGSGQLVTADKSWAVDKGDVTLLSKGMTHAYHADLDKPWSIFWVHFTGQDADAFISSILRNPEQPVVATGVQSGLINDLERLLLVRQTGYNLKVFVHAANLLRQILSFIALQSSKTSQGDESPLDLDAIHSYMLRHIHGRIELAQLARECHLSKYYFAKRYKAMTGHAPIQQFIHYKMEYACNLLDVTSREINQIATDLGYEDAYYFSRLFKKVVGMSPLDYRRLKYR
ncbi:MAG: AraC family transcriptional regulator [Pseudomonadales bacterium]|nr:AraC family transcriptional regulator [Pseudomonadales bacterium]